MGRYSSVQAFSDNATGVRKVPYEQATAAAAAVSGGGNTSAATTSSTSAGLAAASNKPASVQPEKVVNPYGSTAGAGSSNFHIYRHARNREMHRQKVMEEDAAEQNAEQLYQNELAKNKAWEEERTAKRRKKRERQKNAKKRKQNLAKAGIEINGGSNNSQTIEQQQIDNNDDGNDEEFSYTPGEALVPPVGEELDTPANNGKTADVVMKTEEGSIPNDGSFLETMKKKLQQEQQDEAET